MPFGKIIFVVALCSILAACGNAQQKEARYIERGNKLFEKNEFEKARVEYKNAAQLAPTTAEPRYRLGLVDEAEGDLRNAFANFNMAEQQDAHFHPAALKVGQYFMGAEQYAEAHKRVDAVLAEDPKDAEAHAINAALLLREKKMDTAESEAKTALSEDPANVSGIAALTGIYAAEDKTDQAVTILNDGIAHNPGNLALLMLRVLLYEKSGDLAKIDESYQAIFKLKPDAAQYRVDLASIYTKAGRLDQAEAVLRQGIAERPEDWELKHRLVIFLADHRSVAVAEKEMRDLMRANPKNDDLYFWLADLYASHGQTDKAVGLLQQIIDRSDSGAPALSARNLLARIDIRQGNKPLAQKLVAAVLEKQPDNHPALYMRANLEVEDGDYQSAVSDLRDITREDPKDTAALQLLAEALLSQGHLDLAIDTLQKVSDLEPLNFAARVRLAQMVFANGNHKQAMELITLITKAAPDDAVGWETAARFAISEKEWLPAEQAAQTLDKIDGQHLTASFLEGQILENTGKSNDALTKYKEVIAADPSAPLAGHALTSLMGLYQKDNRMADAVAYLQSLNSDAAMVQTMLGRADEAMNKKDEAAGAYDKAIAANASFQDPYIDRARIYLDQGKADLAEALLRKATEAMPGDFRAPLMAAQILSSSGHNTEAIAIYQAVLARNPGMNAAANNMAEMIADNPSSSPADLEKARQTAERFSGSTNPLLLDTLAWVYYRQGNNDQAQTVMERVMAQSKDLPPQIHYHYGLMLLKEGKKAEAKAELEKAAVPGEPYPGQDDARKQLSTL